MWTFAAMLPWQTASSATAVFPAFAAVYLLQNRIKTKLVNKNRSVARQELDGCSRQLAGAVPTRQVTHFLGLEYKLVLESGLL